MNLFSFNFSILYFFAAASVKSVMSEKETHHPMSNMLNMEQQPKGPSRHMLYAQHFPIPYEDSVH